MAVDTRQKRMSMMGMRLHALRGTTIPLFEPDGAVDLDDRQHLLGLYSGIAFKAKLKGKGRPTVTYIDRQAVLLWAELWVPEPVVEAVELAGPLETILAPPAIPPILSGARAYRPSAPTPILVLDAIAVLAWVELRVPSPPLELTEAELMAAMLIFNEED